MVTLTVLLCVSWIGDWAEFRGSRADATSSGPATPLVWSDTENIAWKTEDPFVVALNANDGQIAWHRPRSNKGKISHSFGTPIVNVIDGKAQMLAPGPDHFAAYDLANGEELWHVRAPGWSVVPQPVIGHGMAFYNHDYVEPAKKCAAKNLC